MIREGKQIIGSLALSSADTAPPPPSTPCLRRRRRPASRLGQAAVIWLPPRRTRPLHTRTIRLCYIGIGAVWHARWAVVAPHRSAPGSCACARPFHGLMPSTLPQDLLCKCLCAWARRAPARLQKPRWSVALPGRMLRHFCGDALAIRGPVSESGTRTTMHPQACHTRAVLPRAFLPDGRLCQAPPRIPLSA